MRRMSCLALEGEIHRQGFPFVPFILKFIWWIGVVAVFSDAVLGRFLQNLAVFMNWCDMSSVDSLWWSLTIQWWGVGTR